MKEGARLHWQKEFFPFASAGPKLGVWHSGKAPIRPLPACWKIFMSPPKLGAHSGFLGPPDRQGCIPAAVWKEACRPGSCARRWRLPAATASYVRGRHTSVTTSSREVGAGEGPLLPETSQGSCRQARACGSWARVRKGYG